MFQPWWGAALMRANVVAFAEYLVLVVTICVTSICVSAARAEPTIQGKVFLDTDGDGQGSSAEWLTGIAVQLYRDNGDGRFGEGDSLLPVNSLTDSAGEYQFDNLDADAGYFVSQPAQLVGGQPIVAKMSGLLEPGRPGMIIDTFLITQSLVASPLSRNRSSMVAARNENQILGYQRDAYLEYRGGIAELELRANPFSLDTNLHFDTSAGVTGMAVVTWDGMDDSAGMTPAMGLHGMDLTHEGENTGIMLRMGTDWAGDRQMLTLRLFAGDATTYSEANVPIPVTGGKPTGFAYVPFSSFSGDVDPTHIDALQMILEADAPSVDAQIDLIGAIGPQVHDFAVSLVPEPAAGLLMSLAATVVVGVSRPSRRPSAASKVRRTRMSVVVRL